MTIVNMGPGPFLPVTVTFKKKQKNTSKKGS